MEESMRLKERVRIFLWDVFWKPISNFFSAKIKISDLFLSMWILSTLAFFLEKFKILPLGLSFLANVFLNLGLLIFYIILHLIYKWTNKEDIAHYRKEHKIPNEGDIRRMAQQAKENAVTT